MSQFKKRDHYYMYVKGQPVEVSEEIYRVHINSYNCNRKSERRFFNRNIRQPNGDYITLPATFISMEEDNLNVVLKSDPTYQPDFMFERNQILKALEDAITALPPRYKQVIVYLYFEHLTQNETAEIMSISQATVSYFKSKALKLLKCSMLAKGFCAADVTNFFPEI